MKKVLITSLLSFLAFTTLADSWRCGSNLINTGDTKGSVLVKCGNPYSTTQHSYTKQQQNNEKRFIQSETMIEELIYKDNGNVFRLLTFKNGQLTQIEFQRCGVNPSPLCP